VCVTDGESEVPIALHLVSSLSRSPTRITRREPHTSASIPAGSRKRSVPQLAKGQTEVASCERWRRRHFLRQKVEETPLLKTKGGGARHF